jgi:hypothetical protein
MLETITTKASEPSTWTGLAKIAVAVGLLYAGNGCAAPTDIASLTLGDLASKFGLTDGLAALGLLIGAYDVARKEGAPRV